MYIQVGYSFWSKGKRYLIVQNVFFNILIHHYYVGYFFLNVLNYSFWRTHFLCLKNLKITLSVYQKVVVETKESKYAFLVQLSQEIFFSTNITFFTYNILYFTKKKCPYLIYWTVSKHVLAYIYNHIALENTENIKKCIHCVLD